MLFFAIRIRSIALILVVAVTTCSLTHARADQTNPAEFRTQFSGLCDVAVAQVTNSNSKGPFFADSYAIRALCVEYDMTGNQKYLDACRAWSDRMIKYQEQMTPPGAYYMHYNRKPGETNGDWYAADSSSIGMAVLATSVRCPSVERQRYLASAEKFASLVMSNYVKPDGGVTDGIWHESQDEWWCSSCLFGSFLFNLYANTDDARYLKTALAATDWLNRLDLNKKQPFPLSQQGPAMIFYVMENYCAGWPYIEKEKMLTPAARGKANWCLSWIAGQQSVPIADRQWQPTKGWGMKLGGLPFDEYIFSLHFADSEKLTADGDAEMKRLAAIAFTGKPEFTQLTAFLMMAYAERLDPGAIYRAAK